MKAKIDLEKFICSYVKWNNIQDALKDQGLKCWNGEIVEIPQESEDERIKKEILELISISGNGNQFEEIKDWLEKQAPQEQDGFEAELNALLKKYEHLPKEKLADSLEFYLWVVGRQSIKERLMEGAKPETLEEKETKAIKEYMENLKKRIEDNQLGGIVQRLDKIIELLSWKSDIIPYPYTMPITYKRPLDPDPNVPGGWTTTASTFGSDYDIDTDRLNKHEQ